MKKSVLEHQQSFFEFGNEKPLIRRIIESIERNLRLEILFHPNILSHSFTIQFQIVILVNVNFNFGFSQFLISKISLLFT